MKIYYPTYIPPSGWSMSATGWPVLAIVVLCLLGIWKAIELVVGMIL